MDPNATSCLDSGCAAARHRFGQLPEAVDARTRDATADELDRWTEAVLGATTLDAALR